MNNNINLTPIRILNNGEVKSYGTGILFKLENDEYDLVVTCAHCLNSVKDKSEISIEVYNNGKNKFEELDKESILDYYVESNIEDNTYQYDIGAILINKRSTEVDCNYSKLSIDYDRYSYFESSIQGFPTVLKSDEYTKIVVLDGKCIKFIDDTNQSVYQFELNKKPSQTIASSQKQILEGISGSPLYYEKEGIKFLLGMVKEVQSSNGEDLEFSFVYALKIKNALKKLKEEGLIIYDYNNITGELKIKWIRSTNDLNLYGTKEYKEKNILVLGSSGAGKSSFIKTFAEHSSYINSSGDGQTTRSNINYKFSIYEKEPRIELKFLNEKEFAKTRFEHIRVSILKYKLYVLGLPEYDIELEPDIVIKSVMFSLIKIEKNIKKINQNSNIEGHITKLIDLWYSTDFLDLENKRSRLFFLTDEVIKILKEIKEYFYKKEYKFIFKFIFNSNYRKWLISDPEKFNLLKSLIGNSIVNPQSIEKIFLDKLLECDELFFNECNKKIKSEISNQEDDILDEKFKHIVLEQRGYFSYKEFDFLDSGISSKIHSKYEDLIKEEKHKDIDNIDETIIKFYMEIFKIVYDENLMNKSKIKFDLTKFNFDHEIRLQDTLEGEITPYNILNRALRVINGGSISSVISEINIFDSFSSKFSIIMDELKIKSLIFIDTCGLDHIDNGEFHKEKLNKVFIDKNNNIKTIFYIKKLDSGKPTELEKIIPQIYELQPNAVVYCIFNGIDIFYDDTVNDENIIKWDNEIDMPKSPQYILSEYGKEDIKKSMKKQLIRDGRIKTIYSTLSKNLIPFCSNLEKGKNYKFENNNKYYVKKLFKSVILEEHLGLELVDIKKINKRIETEEFKDKLLILLKKMFEKATILDWDISRYGHGHYRTQEANIKAINKENLGYINTYNDLWSYKFKEAYSYVFSYNHNDALDSKDLFGLEKDDDTYDKLEALIIDFRDTFLGCPKYGNAIFFNYKFNCKVKDQDDYCEKICFRNIVLKMYNSNAFKYSIKEKPKDVSRPEYLNEICNFVKGFDVIKEELVSYFINEFKQKIKLENEKNINTILKINPKINKLFNELKNEINVSFLGSIVNEDEVINMVLKRLNN